MQQDGDDVALPAAQRRYFQRKDVKAKEKVFPEFAFPDHLGQILVGGRDDPAVDVDGPVAAQADDITFLDNAQQVDLGVVVHLGDLIEKDRAVIGVSNRPGLPLRDAPVNAPST